MQKLTLCALVTLSMLSGCADSSTKGSMKEVNPRITMNFANITGNISINPFLDTASTAGNTDQETENSANIDPRSTVPVGFGGGTASGAIGGDSVLDEIVSRFDPDIDESQENVGNPVDNSDNSATTPAVVPVVVDPTEENSEGTAETVYTDVYKVSPLRLVGGRSWERFGETTNQPGSIFGENILVKFSDGSTLNVPDGSVDYAPNGSSGDAWICGTMSPADESQGDTGGVWGPAEATWYEIHYNK